MKVLALDLSTKTGWSVFVDGQYHSSGALKKIEILDFNVNDEPNKSPEYPKNIIKAASNVGLDVWALTSSVQPDVIVIENTVKGRNRNTQRALEWIHFCVLSHLSLSKVKYMDPSEWRSILDMRLSKEDKKNNSLVSKGKKRGRIGKKHLSVRLTNELLGLNLKLKDNDQSDAILLGMAWCKANGDSQSK